jgi:ATP-binding cassette, subfamily B, bacterial
MESSLPTLPPRQSVSWQMQRSLLARYLKPYWGRAALLGVLILGATGLQLFEPQVVGAFVDGVQAGASTLALLRLALLYLAAAVFRRTLAVASAYLTQDVRWRATNRLRGDLVRHCLRLGMPFHDAHTPGQMIERIDGDVLALSNFLSAFLLQLVVNGLLLLGTLFALALVSPILGLAFAAYALVTILLVRATGSLAVPYWRAERAAGAEVSGFLEERLAGTEDIRTCAAEAYTLHGYYDVMRRQFLSARPASVISMAPWAAAAAAFAINEGAGYLLGLHLYDISAISLGTVFMVLQYNSMVSGPLEMFARQVQDLQGASASILRLEELLGEQPEVLGRSYRSDQAGPPSAGLAGPSYQSASSDHSDRSDLAGNADLPGPARPPAIAPPPVRAVAAATAVDGEHRLPAGPLGVRFAGIIFAYGNGSPVLQDVSFDLAPGQTLGLLGRTGSGKTTVTRLLLRLYQLSGGAILLGDGHRWVDIKSPSLAELRAHIGLVTQNVQIFGASVRDNLTLFGALAGPAGRPVSDTRLAGLLEELGLLDWFRTLPRGLDTQLDPTGTGLSAGQAQLLAMTRLFLRDPGLIILDEATSRLDPLTERLVDRAMERLIAGRTAIIVAHRLATVQRVDRILILQAGRILEEGARARLASDSASHFRSLLDTGLTEVLE